MQTDALDRIDRAILQELAADGRVSNAELAQRVGLSFRPARAGSGCANCRTGA